MFKRIDHIEIVPMKLERSVEFYIDVLGFESEKRHTLDNIPLKEVVYLSLGNTTLELLRMDDPEEHTRSPREAGYRMMAIEIEDMKKTLEYLNEKNIETVWGPVSMGDASRAEIEDPDGLRIELREW